MTPGAPASPISDAEAGRIREQLPAARTVAWLNTGMLGPMPQAAIDAMAAEEQRDREVRIPSGHWERLGALQAGARDAVATLTGVGADQVALMHTTHEGINTCLWGLGMEPGHSVVTTVEEHPGVFVPLRHLRDRTGCEVRIAAWGAGADAFVDGVLAHVDTSTRAVVVSHVSWVTGRTAPLRALRDALPASCRLIVDGAQSAGIVPLDPADGWDAYTVSGQKWPCGPNGTGGLALVDPEAWLPTFGAYMHVTDPLDALHSPVVATGRRFETSQESLAPLAGFAASVGWLVGEVGIERAHAHARALNAYARTQLVERAGIAQDALHGDAHLLGVDVPEGEAPALADHLLARGVVIRALGTARLRLSLAAWNTHADVDRCVDGLADPPGAAPSTT